LGIREGKGKEDRGQTGEQRVGEEGEKGKRWEGRGRGRNGEGINLAHGRFKTLAALPVGSH